MLYLARELHIPDGETLRCAVVDTDAGCVNNIYPFAGEVHSMMLVDEVFLSSVSSLNSLSDIKKIPHPEKGERLYAYAKAAADELILLG